VHLVGVELAVRERLLRVVPRDVPLQQRRRRGQQAERDPGQGGVHPRLQEGEPDAGPDDDVRRDEPDLEPLHDHDDEQPAEGAGQPPQLEVGRVEHRDHQDRADVVDDREGQQEQPCRRRDPAAEQAEHPDRERDVGRHRDPPTPAGVAAACDRDVDQRGDRHAPERSSDRQRGRARVAEVTADELVLDLQADDEEEDDHQRVVDPVLEALLDAEVSDLEAHVGVPEVEVRLRPGRVRPHERCRRGQEQQDRARRLDPEELPQRAGDVARERAVARAEHRTGPPDVAGLARRVR
jgi:hypothetical protein